MARCPFGSHRLVLADDFTCKRCGEDLRLYSAVSDLPLTCYNEARRLWDVEEWEEAVMWLHAALRLRADFAEAYWLLGVIEAKRGRPQSAGQYLARARELGAEADPDWAREPDIARQQPDETRRLISAIVGFCQNVHASFPEAVIASVDRWGSEKPIVLRVTMPDSLDGADGQDESAVAEKLNRLALQLADDFGVEILPIHQSQEIAGAETAQQSEDPGAETSGEERKIRDMTVEKKIFPSDAEPINTDVLIIGGGVQGLWLLNELRRLDYSALLLERERLGGDQTCHSHVYIHQGYLYRDNQDGLIERLRDTQEAWKEWRKNAFAKEGSLFGWINKGAAEMKKKFWEGVVLSCEPATLPPALAGSEITTLLKTPEFCLNGENLVGELQRENADFVSLIRQIKSVTLDADLERVEEVEVEMRKDEYLIFRPKVLVFTAGSGNQELLDLISIKYPGAQERLQKAQQIRRSHMLVVKGKKERFAPLTGVFPELDGLFIAARENEDDGSVVWLVSNFKIQSLGAWLEGVIANLKRLSPLYFDERSVLENLEFGVYEAPKAERRTNGDIPYEERIENFGFQNLWTVWPTKLTLAPRASRELTEEIKKRIKPSRSWIAPQSWVDLCQTPEVAKERWQEIKLKRWDAFCRDQKVSWPLNETGAGS